MELSEVTCFIDGCIYDAPAPCTCACPYGLDIRSFLRKAAKGRLPAAYRDLRTATVFPAAACALCGQECRTRCQRSLTGDEPLDMARLEEAVLRLAGPQPPDVFQVPAKEEKIAVVGAGLAGLSLALCMAQKKYPVTVFDRAPDVGGKLREHPRYAEFKEDILFQFSGEQVEFQLNTEITGLDQLEGYSAVYLATGEGGSDFGLLSGWNPALYSTERAGVFLGGGLCGQNAPDSLAAGPELSRLMEGAIQTGRPSGGKAKPSCPDYRLIPEDTPSVPLVVPQDPAGYTKAEVKQEAARCLQCTCDRCLKRCELLSKYRKPPHQMAMEVMADSGPHFLASRTMTREVYSCNQCGWCGGLCPEGVDLGALFQFSRTARAGAGIDPAVFHDFWLRELDFVSTQGFQAALPPGRERCEYAFFPGCRLAMSLPEQTLAVQELLTERLGAGVITACCGASAWWAGEQELWEENTARLTSAWEELGRPVLILACPTCGTMLRRLAPDIQTVSLYEILAGEPDLPVSAPFPDAALFDPCSARTQPELRGSVRTLLRQAGTAPEELPDPGRCCGWGGHMRTAAPELYDTVAEHRISESDLPYYVYCANCREVFLEKGKPCRHVLEVLFGECGQTYTLSEKRGNLLQVKKELRRRMGLEEWSPAVHPWDGLALSVDDAVRQDMESQLISDDEVKECIWTSVRDGDRFVDGQGVYLASLQKQVITYWVEYTEDGGAYTVRSVYCHRMRFGGEAGA